MNINIINRRDAFKLLAGLLLLAVIFYKNDFASIVGSFHKLDREYLYTGLSFYLLMGFFESARIYMALRGYMLSLGRAIGLYLSGTFFSNFMPGSVGAEIYKIIYLHKLQPGINKPIALMLMLRITGFSTMAILMSIYVLFNREHIVGIFSGKENLLKSGTNVSGYIIPAVLLCIIIVGGLAVKNYKNIYLKVGAAVSECRLAIQAITKNQYLLITILSIFIHAARIASFYFIIRAFGENMFFLDLILVTAFVTFASVLPISFASLGVREGAIIGSLYMFGISQPCAIAVAITSRAALWLFSLAGGLLFITVKKPSAQST